MSSIDFEVTPSEFVWIDGGPVDNDGVIIEDQCYAVKRIVIDQPFNTPGTANCEEPFPFVCVKPTEIQGKENNQLVIFDLRNISRGYVLRR